MLFFDHPDWVQGQRTETHIKSNLSLNKFELYLEKSKDISFIVYQNFKESGGDNYEGDKTALQKRLFDLSIKISSAQWRLY